ncbi:MAG: (d)CMP kinase [Candidatus Dependentiae bacterium]|nr:(d)CMP kinase [Candidatus Dependentiae bacterium]
MSKGLNEQSTAPRLVHPRHADIDAIMQPGRFLYRYVDGSPHVIFDGEDLTPHLKQGEVDDWSSISSADPYVRHAIFEMQVALGREHDLVAEGRDIGTVVFPHADHKFFLTASLSQRATWWRKMQEKLGRNYSSEESLHEVAERDRRDMSREHSPLTKAPDAIEIDGSDMTIDQLVAQMRRRIEGD